MVIHLVTALRAGFLGLFKGGQKVSEFRVFQHTRQFAGGPRLVAGIGNTLDGFERAGCLGKGLVFHGY